MLLRRTLPAFALTLGSAASLFAQDAADQTIFGALRIGSINQLAEHAAAFAEKIQPGSGANAAQIGFGAAMFGIDADAEILVALLDPATAAQPFALVIPVVDPESFKANPAFAVQPTETPDVFRFNAPNGQPFYASFVGKRLVAAPLPSALAAVLPAVRADADIRGLRAVGGDLALSLAPDRLYAAYKPIIDMMLLGMRGQFTQAAGDAQTPNPADMFAANLGSVGELQTIALSVTLAADHIDLRSEIVARPGTAAATLLSPGRGPAVATLGLHDPASAVFGTISAKPGPEFWQAYGKLTANFLAAAKTPNAAGLTAAIDRSIADFAATWDGTASFGMFADGRGISGSGIAGTTDADKAFALIQSLPDLQKQFAALNEAQGLVTEAAVGEVVDYEKARLLDVTQTYRALRPELEQSLETMKKMGLDRFVSTYAVTPSGRVIYAVGADSRTEAKRLVDAADAPAASITPAAFDLPAQSTFFLAVSLPRYAAWIGQVAGLPSSAKPASDARPGFGLSADLDGGRADLRLRLQAAEIAALVGMFNQPAPASAAAVE